jgi:5-(carboxyamino)imidazole ribonucleotide mutase
VADNPKVIVAMGSESDLPVAQTTVEELERLEIPFEVRVVSAHRSPDAVVEMAGSAEARGVQVIIAVAGGAAHLAGTIAAHTALPVIGVPAPTQRMGGLDSLFSTLQMPGGVPVACVGLGRAGAQNAAVLAAQILAVGDPDIRPRLGVLKARLASHVTAQDAKVRQWLLERTEA